MIMQLFFITIVGHIRHTQNITINIFAGICRESLDNCTNPCETITFCNVPFIVCVPEYCNGTCSAMFVDAETDELAHCQ
ncbi:unnamed protein product [Gordionus sp. m RMFG-2023]